MTFTLDRAWFVDLLVYFLMVQVLKHAAGLDFWTALIAVYTVDMYARFVSPSRSKA